MLIVQLIGEALYTNPVFAVETSASRDSNKECVIHYTGAGEKGSHVHSRDI